MSPRIWMGVFSSDIRTMTGTLSAAILVALGFFAQAKPPTVPEAPLAPGEVMLAGRKVALDFPADEPFVGTWGRLGGAAFAVGADGSVGARVYPEGFWQAAKSRFASFKPDPDAPPYHVKMVVATEAAILERRDDGTVVARRGNIASKQLDVLLAGVARFKALAEMEAGGKVNLAIDLMLDDDPVFLDLSRGKAANLGNPASLEPNPQSIARSLALGDLAPLVNDDSFETDDRVFRGPYESAFYVHPLLTPASGEYDLGRTPASVIPFFELGQARTETTFPLALLAAWRTHVAKNAARNAGLEASWDPRAEVSPAMVVGALRGAHAQLPASKTDPWTWDDFAGQAVGGEGSVRTSAGSGDLLAVRPDLAAHLADASPVGVLRGPMPLAVVRAAHTGETEAQRLGMTLEASPAQGPYACGDFSLDADGVTITENPPGRKGFVAFPISRTGAPKTLGLRISIQSAEDYALDLVNSEGKPLATLLLSERVRLPVEVGPPAQPLFVASVPADGQSHEIRVDLSGVPNLEGLAAVRFGPPPEGSCYERQKLATPKITIEDLAILGQASGVAPVPYAPPQIPAKPPRNTSRFCRARPSPIASTRSRPSELCKARLPCRSWWRSRDPHSQSRRTSGQSPSKTNRAPKPNWGSGRTSIAAATSMWNASPRDSSRRLATKPSRRSS